MPEKKRQLGGVSIQEYAVDPHVQEFRLDCKQHAQPVLRQLITELNPYLDCDNVWDSGARFVWEDTDESALIVVDSTALRILIRSEQAERHPRIRFETIRATLDDIFKNLSFPNPKVLIEFKKNGTSSFFPYDNLKRALKRGEESVFSKTFDQLILIRDILDFTNRAAELRIQKLCRDVAEVCAGMQGEPALCNKDAKTCNERFQEHLRDLHYSIIGAEKLSTRKDRGVLSTDAVLMNENHEPWTVFESIKPTSRTHWEEHLKRLLIYYASFDLPIRFQICYVDCAESQYVNLVAMYMHQIETFVPKGCYMLPGSYARLKFPDMEDPYLNAMKCTYEIDKTPVTVYFYFAWMHGNGKATSLAAIQDNKLPISGEQENQVENLKKESAPAESTVSEEKKLPAKQEETPRSPEPVQKTHTTVSAATDEKNKTPVSTEYRVVLLGDGEAGKSLVWERLTNDNFNLAQFKGDVTNGVNIAYHDYWINKNKVRINYWDFGGQEILHPLHRMFLARQTLYVILLNTRHDNHDDRALFWLRFVQTFAAGAPVLMVLNKIDQNPDAELNEPVLESKHPNYRGMLKLSALTWNKKQFQDEFENKLTELVGNLLNESGEKLTFEPTEMQVATRIRNMEGSLTPIPLDTFRKICSDVDPSLLKDYISLLNRFHAAGICVFYSSSETQTQLLLDPMWITGAVYKILEKRDTLSRNGIVPHETIGEIFDEIQHSTDGKNFRYGREHVSFVLSVMRQFRLSYKMADREEEFIPMLCRNREPKIVKHFLADPATREMKLRYDYLPAHMLYQLIVDCRNSLDLENVWRYGAVINHSEPYSSVILRDGNTLTICTGRRKTLEEYEQAAHGEALPEIPESQVRQDAKEAAKNMNYLLGMLTNKYTSPQEEHRGSEHSCYNRIDERLIAYKHEGKKEYFDMERLELAEKKGLHSVASKCKNGSVYISDILDQVNTSEDRAKDILLEKILIGCTEIQKHNHLCTAIEDIKNQQLACRIRDHFIVLDQTQGGQSESGENFGEFDLDIRINAQLPWVLLEALRLYGAGTADTENWEKHLKKLVDNYNPSGLRYLVLVSYAECSNNYFNTLLKHYDNHLKTHHPATGWGLPEICEVEMKADWPSNVHLVRAEYMHNGSRTTLYHFLVLIPRQTSNAPKNSRKGKKSKSKSTSLIEKKVSQKHSKAAGISKKQNSGGQT